MIPFPQMLVLLASCCCTGDGLPISTDNDNELFDKDPWNDTYRRTPALTWWHLQPQCGSALSWVFRFFNKYKMFYVGHWHIHELIYIQNCVPGTVAYHDSSRIAFEGHRSWVESWTHNYKEVRKIVLNLLNYQISISGYLLVLAGAWVAWKISCVASFKDHRCCWLACIHNTNLDFAVIDGDKALGKRTHQSKDEVSYFSWFSLIKTVKKMESYMI